MAMGKKFEVSANGQVFSTYGADDAQNARDLCAVDAGYKSEADMVNQLGQPSELVASEVGNSGLIGLQTIDAGNNQ